MTQNCLVLRRELTKIIELDFLEKNAVLTNAVHSSYVYVYLGNKEEAWMLHMMLLRAAHMT